MSHKFLQIGKRHLFHLPHGLLALVLAAVSLQPSPLLAAEDDSADPVVQE